MEHTRRPPPAPSWAAAALLAFLLAGQLALRLSSAAVWQRVDGQPLADAVARWGASNSDATFVLPPDTIVDLRDAQFGRNSSTSGRSGTSRPPFSNGTLTIKGLRSFESLLSSPNVTSSSVLDAGMRFELVPSMVLAHVAAEDFSLVNLCFNAAPMENLAFATTSLLGVFGLTPVVLAVNHSRTVDYIPPRDLTFVAYTLIAWRWEAVSERYARQKNALTGLVQILNFHFTSPHEVHAWSMQPGRPPGDLLFRSIRKPGDPLMDFMRERGLLMPLQWCGNGSLVASEVADSLINEQWGPLWLVDSTPDLAAGLANATALAPAQLVAQMPIPGVAIIAPRLALPDAALPTLPLAAPVLLHGTLGEEEDAAPWPVLDVGARVSALLSALPGSPAQLLISRLALLVPALQVQGVAVPSALPLTSLVETDASAPLRARVELFNAALLVPALDFLALLTLATDGRPALRGGVRPCVDNATLRHAAQLRAGIQALQLGNASWARLTLAAYRGWGVNASLLTLQPQTPVPAGVTQRCGAFSDVSASAAAPAGDGGDGVPVGVIVGCTVGGAALLVALAGIAAVLWRRRRRAGGWPYRSDKMAQAAGVEGKAPSGSSSSRGAAELTPHATASSSSARGAADGALGAPASRRRSQGALDLISELQSQEQQMLVRAGATAAGALLSGQVGGGGIGVGGGPSSLTQAHEQLMGVVRSRQQQHGVDSEAGGRQGGGEQGSALGQVPPDFGHAVEEASFQLLRGQRADGDTVCLSEVLGRGSNGIVYAGNWRGLPVAVKTIVFEAWEGGGEEEAGAARGPSTAGKARLRFVRAVMETAISASVGHRHVVATYCFDIKRVDDDVSSSKATQGLQVTGTASLDITRPPAGVGVQAYKVFLIQELCTCPLRMVLQHGALQINPNKLSAVASLLHQVATGLEYLHGRGIIHGDLTPSNILIKVDDSVPGRLLAKLADFGLSLRLEAQATHVSNMAAGTPFYVAPEVVGCKRTSRASDIFSLGVVAWEMYTGCPPFAQAPGGGLCINTVFPAFPPDRRPPPADVIRLIHRCLQAEPSHRPTASELAAAYSQHVYPPPPSNQTSA